MQQNKKTFFFIEKIKTHKLKIKVIIYTAIRACKSKLK